MNPTASPTFFRNLAIALHKARPDIVWACMPRPGSPHLYWVMGSVAIH